MQPPTHNREAAPAEASVQRLDDSDLDDFGDLEAATALPEAPPGTVGFTHFDGRETDGDLVTVLLPREHLDALTPGAMVRIVSPADPRSPDAVARDYEGVVVAGPFTEPDAITAASPIAVATTLGGKARLLLPNYHGRVRVQVTAERVGDVQGPPRHRPRPNSAVVPFGDDETAAALKADGPVPLGTLLGNADIPIRLDPAKKGQLPRHLGVLGTTGGGKSNTVAGIVGGLSRAGTSVVLLDVEGEYIAMNEPADDPHMCDLLRQQGIEPRGVSDFRVLTPVGRGTARDGDSRPFSLAFEDLSPYAVMDVLDLTEAQQTRFLKAYDVLKILMRDLGVFPRKGVVDDTDRLLELDEFDSGYPHMTLAMLRDVIQACADRADNEGGSGRSKKADDAAPAPASRLASAKLKEHEAAVRQQVAIAKPPGNYVSWIALLGKLNRIARLGLFDSTKAPPIDPASLTAPGRVTVLDLSDTDSPVVNNLIIAGLLRQIQRQQDRDADAAARAGTRVSPTVVVIEEAHEFLSRTRIKEQAHLFEQVARIAKRGRKRWLGLCFVTQLPQHLPDEVLSLINNYVLHAVRDADVLRRLERQVPGLDKSQWAQVPSLAPGQAVVSLATAARPVLAQVHPAACRMRLTE